MDPSIADYCRQIEVYLCRKNDGHLVRVVGPAFEVVSGWAAKGVPLKVAFRGIDRYFERYYRQGPRRRPVRIDFCEADVLDVFDEWRRALGLGGESSPPSDTRADDGGGEAVEGAAAGGARRGPSLPEHLERALLRLTSARAAGRLGDDTDRLLDQVASELDRARASAAGIRGAARRALIERLSTLDADLIAGARRGVAPEQLGALEREADDELAGYRERMSEDAFARARAAAVDRLLRQHLGLPVLTFL